MEREQECPVCKSQAYAQINYDTSSVFYVCPICGRFQLTLLGRKLQNNPHLASFLYYNCFPGNQLEYRYHSTLSIEKCDEYKKNFENGDTSHGRPVHIDNEIVESWYPKTFSERVDYILLHLNTLAKHIGQAVSIDKTSLYALTFVDRMEYPSNQETPEWREDKDCYSEAAFILDYLVSEGFIEHQGNVFRLTPKGYSRVDALQKNTSNGRLVLVAMKFGDDTLVLRESIREGIENAGYIAIFIDEVQHNEFITPELLKYIRDSKFVVVDLTHQNNGAYFEEGYAMGLGKPVIQLCQKDTKLHFDIAQKNTIIWDTEEEIPTRLENRIRATID